MSDLEFAPHYPPQLQLGGVTFQRDELIGRELAQNGCKAEATYAAKVNGGKILISFQRLQFLDELTFEHDDGARHQMEMEDRAGYREVVLRTSSKDLGLLLDPTVTDWKKVVPDMIEFHKQHGFGSTFPLDYDRYQLGIYATDFVQAVMGFSATLPSKSAAQDLCRTIVSFVEQEEQLLPHAKEINKRLSAPELGTIFSRTLNDAPAGEESEYRAQLKVIAKALLPPALRENIQL